MEQSAKTMLLSSFIADSLALGVHWIYDTENIKESFGTVDSFIKPGPDSYHNTKNRGEFTHYGDQAFVLLESIASKKGFDKNDFSFRWMDLFKEYNGYYDHATKGTMQNLENGHPPLEAGSTSQDLAGASRIAPIIFCYRDNPDLMIEFARTQTRMTHNDEAVIDCSEFIARLTHMVLHGTGPVSAMEQIANDFFKNSPLSEWVKEGIKSRNDDSISTIAGFGMSCFYADAFPGIVHLIAKYESRLKDALIESVMAGGDSASRAMAVSIILGACSNLNDLPEEWISGLIKGKKILTLADSLL